MDLTFSDTFSFSPLTKVFRQHFLGAHNVERLAFGTDVGKNKRESEILPDTTQRAPFI